LGASILGRQFGDVRLRMSVWGHEFLVLREVWWLQFYGGVNFRGVFGGTSVWGASILVIFFRGCQFKDRHFEDVNFAVVNFWGVNFEARQFWRCHFSGPQFWGHRV
jgi:uncharacterized protein YjbI with pentapeptide repeats